MASCAAENGGGPPSTTVQNKRAAAKTSGTARKAASDRAKLRSGPWKLYEDQALAEAVERLGPHNWTRVAACVPGRSGKSCRLRWCNQLNPHVNKAKFSAWEQAVVHHSFTRFGGKWALIAQLLPGRTDNSVKNFWNCAAKKNPTNPVSPNNPYLTSGQSLEVLLEDGPPKETLESYTAAKKAASESTRRRSDDDECFTVETESKGPAAVAARDSTYADGSSSARSTRSGQFFAPYVDESPGMDMPRDGSSRFGSQPAPSNWVDASDLGLAADMLCGRGPTDPSCSVQPARRYGSEQYDRLNHVGSDGMAYFYRDVADMVGSRPPLPTGFEMGPGPDVASYHSSTLGMGDYARFGSYSGYDPQFGAQYGQYSSNWA